MILRAWSSSATWPTKRWERSGKFAALSGQWIVAGRGGLVAAQDGQGGAAQLRPGALCRWIGGGVFHHLRGVSSEPSLRVINSALLDGALLLGLGGLHGVDRGSAKSELLALFAIGLAYYSLGHHAGGRFHAVLESGPRDQAVVFLVRNRWAGLSWASMVATYASYAWWRFYHGVEGWRWAAPDEGSGFGASFLFCYWVSSRWRCFCRNTEDIAGEQAGLVFHVQQWCVLLIVCADDDPGAHRRVLAVLAGLWRGAAGDGGIVPTFLRQ